MPPLADYTLVGSTPKVTISDGGNSHQLGVGLWLVQLSHASCGDVCRPKQESQELHAEDDLKYGGCDGCHL